MEIVKLDIYFDGACHNKKDSATEPFGSGVAVYIDSEYSEEFSRDDISGYGTSNIAEWEGCVAALKTLSLLYKIIEESQPYTQIQTNIFSDSQLIVRQFNGEYEVRQEHFKKYYQECIQLAKPLEINKLTWIPREQNTKADELSKIALTTFRDNLK